MGFYHGKGAAILVAQYDLSAFLNQFSAPRTLETADVTTFGKSAHEYIGGLKDASMSLSGFFDGAANAVDVALSAALGASAPKAISILPQGSGTIGNRAIVTKADETQYSVEAAVGDAVTISCEFQPTGGAHGGLVLADLAARTTSTNLTSVDNSASSANGLVANLHVTAFTGTNVVIKVQHSSDNSTFADLITFTTVAGVTSEQAETTSTVNRYIRAIVASGTFSSVTFAVTAARK